jgi:hypothetical protein
MNHLTLDEFRERSGEFDAAVAATPEISNFCSESLWQLSARDCLHHVREEAPHFIVEDEGRWLVFAEKEQAGVFFPFESAWMFGCPLIGDPEKSVTTFLDATSSCPQPTGFCIGGIGQKGRLHEALQKTRSHWRRYQEFPGTDCMIINLVDGVEAWLGRRSRKFQRTIRNAESGNEIEIISANDSSPEDIFQRILRIQKQTYKWQEGTDIFQIPEYAAFYERLIKGLHDQGKLRLLFAMHQGEEVAHILGGVSGGTYRGLQMSFVESLRPLGLGNRLQLENLRRCAAEGITRYDLGMHSAYKERWADHHVVSLGVFVVL